MGIGTEGRLLARMSSCCRRSDQEWFSLELNHIPFRLVSYLKPTAADPLDAAYLLTTPWEDMVIHDFDELLARLSRPMDGARKQS